MDNVKILVVVGMSGSGKSVVVDHLTDKGYPKVYFGGMIYKEMEKRGIVRTEDGESEKKFREEIREKEGKDWVVNQVIAETKDLIKAGQKRIILDGVYSWTEYKILKHEFPTCLTFIAIVVDKKLRYERVAKRPERPFDGKAIRERDRSEIENLEKGGPIAAADYYILNNGTIEDVQHATDRIHHLSHTAITGVAYDVAKFIKELSKVDLEDAPEEVKYPLSDFLHELDYEHYDKHIDADHDYIKKTEGSSLVHGDLNLGNILLDENDKVVGVIDFCFAGTGNPNMDVARMVSRPAPAEFEKAFLSYFDDEDEIERMRDAWQHIDNGYAEHIRAHFPEINLNQL